MIANETYIDLGNENYISESEFGELIKQWEKIISEADNVRRLEKIRISENDNCPIYQMFINHTVPTKNIFLTVYGIPIIRNWKVVIGTAQLDFSDGTSETWMIKKGELQKITMDEFRDYINSILRANNIIEDTDVFKLPVGNPFYFASPQSDGHQLYMIDIFLREIKYPTTPYITSGS